MDRGRRPRYGSFLLTGGLVGLLVTVVVVLVPGQDVEGRGRLFFFLGLLLVGLGVLLGGLLAVLLEGRIRHVDKPGDSGRTDPDT